MEPNIFCNLFQRAYFGPYSEPLEGSGTPILYIGRTLLNPLNAKLNPICHLLALLEAHHILHVSRIRVKG